MAVTRVLAALVATLGLVLGLLYSGYLGYTKISPVEVEVQDHELEVDETGRRVTYGRSWLARRGRLWQMHLEGTPAEMGDAHGRLTGRLFRRLDTQIDTLVSERYGTRLEAWAEGMLLRWDYRASETALRPPDLEELSALASALPEAERTTEQTYHRLFLMQCLLDVTQRLDDVMIDGVMFAVATRPSSRQPMGGNLVIGRTLSVDLGKEFETDRLVTFYYPDGKYPFASVGWAGLVGVVTGINARGIFVSVNAARSDEPREQGVALPALMREVLENADTLEQALEIIDQATVRTPGIVLVGDGVQRKAVVVELGPGSAKDGKRVITGEDQAVVYATNHMTRELFESDAHNNRIERATASGYRYDRLGELLGDTNNFGPEQALDVLRDRRGTNNAELGLGNLNALDTLSTSQSVVVDATAMILWVAEGPSNLGRYRAFDLAHLLARRGSRPAPLDDLTADRLLYSEEFHDYLEAREELAHARFLLANRRHEEALSSAQIALALAPDLGELHRTLGDIERELDHPDLAIQHYRRYLELVPGKARDQEVVKGIIEELGG